MERRAEPPDEQTETTPETGSEVTEPGLVAENLSLDGIDPQLLQMLLTLNDDEVLVPLRMKREDVHRLKGVKLSDEEVARVQKFQAYLFDRGYLPDNTFASLFCYLFNVSFTWHRQVAEEEARKEEIPR